MAMAVHMPNCFMLMPKAEPMLGNRKSATALSTNTTAKATERFSDFAFNTEPTAAMAEPPQIAVPELKR